MALRRPIVFALVVAARVATAAAAEPPTGPDAAPWQHQPVRSPTYASLEKRSVYVAARDGVKLAVDIYLPMGLAAGTRLPTILEQTRYYRSTALKADPVGSCKAADPTFTYFGTRGYAVVVVDARGSGASFGTRTGEYSDAEVKDGGTIADWIVAQPWSNGRIGSMGVSYVGATAEMLLRNHHPAVKAVAPVSAGYDYYTDIDFPGGSKNTFFAEAWAAGNAALDSGRPFVLPDFQALAGPCPVDGDANGASLAVAVREHAGNANSAAQMSALTFRDDGQAEHPEGWPSAYRYRAQIDSADVPLLSIVGWTDSGYGLGGINRFLNTTSSKQRLILTPTGHGLGFFYAPGTTAPTYSGFDDKAELLRFFDQYVGERDSGYDREPRLRWFTTGSNIWRSAQAWPATKRTVRYCFMAGRGLSTRCGGRESETVRPEADARTGDASRWNTTLGGGPVFYADRGATDGQLLSYTSSPLDTALEVTGVPVVDLSVTNTAADADYFVYLEEVDARGRSNLVSEGVLRASHARPGPAPYIMLEPARSDLRHDALTTAGKPVSLRIGLQPFSHRFAPGSRLRVAIAGSDKAHFASPNLAAQRWTVALGAGGSTLSLPIVSSRDH